MDSALIVVTLVSLALASMLLVFVWRLLREERRRSAARVAALEAEIRSGGSEAPIAMSASPQAIVAPAPSSTPLIQRLVVVRASAAPENPLSRFLDTDNGDSKGQSLNRGGYELFGATARPSPTSRRFGMVAAIGLLVVGAALGTALLSSHGEGRSGSGLTPHIVPTAAAPKAPLELVALRHRRDADSLSITGVVRNPVSGARLQNLTAVVFLFGRDGSFLASGRAPIDYSTLPPGDESPFVVTMKVPGAVGRYRVSFRTDDRVMPHVDRREQVTLARSES